jgi:CheY-like chemotaxis protein
LIAQRNELQNLKTVISSSAGIQSDAQALALGFDAACPKPVMQEKLIAKVYELLVSPNSIPALLATPGTPIDQSKRPKDGKRRILVAEDNPSNQRLMVALLESAGYSVDVVGDGIEAVHAAQRLPYDLILMDIRMPAMNGIEATKRIRLMQSPISECPILALTANAMSGDKEEYLAAGLTDYISKPVDFDALLLKIKGYLVHRSGQPENTAACA